MTRITLLLSLLLLVARAASADQVSLKNGDRVTGKIQKKDGASLVMKSDIFGAVTIPWSAIAQLISDEPLTVALADGKSVQGKVTVRDDQLEVTTESGKQAVAIAQVSAIRNADEQKTYERMQHPGILSLWAGYADLGISLARGNATADTITTSVKTARETRNDKVALYFTQIHSRGKLSDGTTGTTADAIRGGWSYNRNFTPHVFVSTFNDFEYDAFQDLDLRVVGGAGLGYQAIRNERTELSLSAGGSYDREKFTPPLTRNSAEAYWGNNFMLRISKVTTLTQSLKMFNNLSDTGQYRFNFDLGTVTSLRKWLSWQLTFSDRYLSDPAPGRKTNDVLLTTGLRFNFAQ